jgi:hypothetical protein
LSKTDAVHGRGYRVCERLLEVVDCVAETAEGDGVHKDRNRAAMHDFLHQVSSFFKEGEHVWKAGKFGRKYRERKRIDSFWQYM